MRRGGTHIDGLLLFPASQNTVADGVAALIHVRHSQSVKRFFFRICSVSDWLIYVDVLLGATTHRMIAAQKPHAGYPH